MTDRQPTVSDPRRVPGVERRQMLVRAGVEIARLEGGKAVTLTRVAEACGVTKPIAYRLFADLPDLLGQMQQQVVAGYESAIGAALEAARGASRVELLAVLADTYVRHSLAEGAVYDTVAAALAANAVADDPPFVVPSSYRAVARDRFGVPSRQEIAVVAMFVGAADALVVAVQAGHVTRQDAVGHLIDLFTPLLGDRSGT